MEYFEPLVDKDQPLEMHKLVPPKNTLSLLAYSRTTPLTFWLGVLLVSRILLTMTTNTMPFSLKHLERSPVCHFPLRHCHVRSKRVNSPLIGLSGIFPLLSRILSRISRIYDVIQQHEKQPEASLTQFNQILTKYSQQRIPGEDKNDFLQFFKNTENLSWNGYIHEKGEGIVDVGKVQVQRAMTPGVGF